VTVTGQNVVQAAESAFQAIVDRQGLSLVAANVGYSLLGNSRESIEKMFRVKGRTFQNPCIVAGTMDTFDAVMLPVVPRLRAWVADVAQWAPLAVVSRINRDSPPVRALDPWVLDHCTVGDTVAVFVNTGPFVEHMVRRAHERGILLVGSSGNRSGHGNNYTYQDVPPEILARVDFAVDLGPAEYANDQARATTIVDLTTCTMRRKGVKAEEIFDSFVRLAAGRDDLPAELTVTVRSPA
jgi:tRNA A37 threonylcarbamoyladenosine synthetase subunit TsaC/SUA5/YrdC